MKHTFKLGGNCEEEKLNYLKPKRKQEGETEEEEAPSGL